MTDFTKEIKQNGLPVGFIAVCGCQGAGKTSLVSAMLKTDYKKHNKKRLKESQMFVDVLKTKGYKGLKLPNHLYYTNTKIELEKGIYTHYIDTQFLGLPNDDFETIHFPKHSVVFVQESDIQMNCRDWANMNDYLVALLKYVRHNQMTIIFDCQINGKVDKALRDLETLNIYVYAKTDKKRFLFIPQRTVWKAFSKKAQMISAFQEMQNLGLKFDKSMFVSKIKFKYRGNIYKSYDSFSGISYFLYKLKQYEILEFPKINFSQQSVIDYRLAFPLEKPKETRKKK